MRLVNHLAGLAVLFAVATGCTWTDTATDFNGLTDHEGHKVTHTNHTRLALNLLIFEPLVGNASMQANVAEITAQAKADGANGVRIVQSNESTWWWCFFPISLIITPVVSNVAADVVHG